ncbi:redox-sensing transcriptional repressor [Hydrogenispora ethanolica]|uniref:Redox-sensing transcriptional repressor Rex n=1 Tax=Hydrogenispora ethanolica TaxID=1082276 RepID=A0A4R1RGH8_HYDET|nr:redox-sensing transcriptional repressor Rex [Hydrogenispora ethanolica]TCL64810.1 redox-sensing transcriptional repressor [Hydrogenispora ethanolica]
MNRDKKVPDVVIRRLPLYLRVLSVIDPAELPIISSEQMATMVGTSSVQVRKDLSYFGVFGKQGVGYHTVSLKDELRRILKLDREVRVGLIGAGNLGAALVRYHQRSPVHKPLQIVALFDNDEKKVGRKVAEVEIYHIDQLSVKIRELNIKMMILAFPAVNVQEIVDACVENGITSFLNFVPASIKTPPGIKVQNSDVTLDLQSLAYYT